MKKILLGSLLCLLSFSALAVEESGVQLPEKIQSGDHSLVLNGAGTKLMAGIFKVYVIALYLPKKDHELDTILAEETSKYLSIDFMFDVKSSQLLEATNTLLTENLSEQEYKSIGEGWKEFAAPFNTVTDFKKGDRLSFDYSQKSGIVMALNGKEIGRIKAANFMRGFLKVWLGERPAQAEAKNRLMGL